MHTGQTKKSTRANVRNRLVAGDTVLGKVTDPVKLYLCEMGSVSLLSRKDEIEIAKKIEAGEREVLRAFLETTIGADYLINLGVEIEKRKIRIKHVIRATDEDDKYVADRLRSFNRIHLVKTRIKDPEHQIEKIIRISNLAGTFII